MNRREFIFAGVTTGFALAVSPISGAPITTTETGMETEMTTIPIGTEKLPAFLARPIGSGPFPIVLVVQEIFGVHAYIQDVCRRFAKEGYIAVAPYLYFREGDVTKIKDVPKIISDVVSKVKVPRVLTDLDSALAWAVKTKNADASRVAITGFCWGGGITWMYSAHNPKIKAGVAWYGKLVGQPNPNQSQFPVDIGASLTVPVLGLYGAKDEGIPLPTIEKMRGELAKGKSRSEIIVFPDAEHGFHADYRPSYHEKSAKDAWGQALAWIRKNGAKS